MAMFNSVSTNGCACCSLSRRRFLANCASCAAGVSGVAALGGQLAAADAGAKPKVRLVFTHIPSTGPIWPNIGFDFDKRKKELIEALTRLCPTIQFLPATVMNGEEATKLLEADKEVDGYLVYLLGLWTSATPKLAAANRPMIFADDLYGGSGEFLIQNAAARRAGQKVVGVSSARVEDVAAVARCFEVLKKSGASVDDFMAAAEQARRKTFGRPGDMTCKEDKVPAVDVAGCLKKLRESVMLVVGRQPGALGKAIEEVFGTKVLPIDFKELHAAYEKADQAQAAQWADRWIKAAEKMIEPVRDEIVRCGAMYLGMQEVMKQHKAQAITINCLGGFYGGHIKAYPCLGFSQLNDDGLVGGCEADIRSAMTMLLMGQLTGRPGYISDPVIDTSKNQIIYAHCVAPTKVFGPAGPTNPGHIRSHSEDRKGAVLRSLMPLGYMTTTLELQPQKKEMLFHQGKTVDNIDEDKACRTKLAVEPKGDLDKLLTYWDQWGWHRVTFYGDLKGPVQEVCQALGLKLIEEA